MTWYFCGDVKPVWIVTQKEMRPVQASVLRPEHELTHCEDVCEDDLNWRWAALAAQCVYMCVCLGVGWDYPRVFLHETQRPTGQRDISWQEHHSHIEKVDEWVCEYMCVMGINPLLTSLLHLNSQFDHPESVCSPSLCLHWHLLNITFSYRPHPGTLMRNFSSFLGTTAQKQKTKKHIGWAVPRTQVLLVLLLVLLLCVLLFSVNHSLKIHYNSQIRWVEHRTVPCIHSSQLPHFLTHTHTHLFLTNLHYQ